MPNFVHVILHHVIVASLYELLLTISHCFEQTFIFLLLLYNLLFVAELLALLSDLLLDDVFGAKLS